jgi:hypothetical protein
VGITVFEGDAPVNAAKMSVRAEVDLEDVVEPAASSAVEYNVVDNGSSELEKRDSSALDHEGSEVVILSMSDLETSVEAEELVVFCRAFRLLIGRGK